MSAVALTTEDAVREAQAIRETTEGLVAFSRHAPRAVASVLGAMTPFQPIRISDIYRKSRIGRVPVAEILREADSAGLVEVSSVNDSYVLTPEGARIRELLVAAFTNLDAIAASPTNAQTTESKPSKAPPKKTKPASSPAHSVVVHTAITVTIPVKEAAAILLTHHESMASRDGPDLAAMIRNSDAAASMKFAGNGKIELRIESTVKRT